MTKRDKIVSGRIPPLLIKLTLPSIVGTLSLMIFNVADTYFVSKLGVVELAAISFTFPVIMVINSFILGVGIAAMSLFSKAAGNQDREEEQLLATSSLLLGFIISITLSVIGYFTIEPLFTFLGASNELLPHIIDYMEIWYLGVIFITVPMIGDGILRGLGDTVTPSAVMLTVGVVNIILDPMLIFGLGPFPEMGIKGAALATVFARMIAGVVSILIQTLREDLIVLKGVKFKNVKKEWKDLIYLGVPNAAVKAIVPMGVAVFTSILAQYGKESVAAYGVAARVESIFMAVLNALGITAAVFVGQNLGAKKYERIKEGIFWLYSFSIIFGLFSAIILWISGYSISGLFTDNLIIRDTVTLYLLVVPITYGLYGVGQTGASILNVYHEPLSAAGLNLFQMGLIAVPLGYLFSMHWSEFGLFIAISLSFAVLGILSYFVVRRKNIQQSISNSRGNYLRKNGIISRINKF